MTSHSADLASRTSLTAALAAVLLVGTPVAQERDQQEPDQRKLEQKRVEKLAKPVFKKAAWHFDYDAARAAAKEQGKFLLAYFTRSYAA
jgi:hypothetical protein